MLSIQVAGRNQDELVAKAAIVGGKYFDTTPDDVRVHIFSAKPIERQSGEVVAFTADAVVYQL